MDGDEGRDDDGNVGGGDAGSTRSGARETGRAELLRSIGGLLFGAGALVLFIRKSGPDQWSGVARLFVLLIPAVLLYFVSLGVFDRDAVPRRHGSRSLLLTAAVLLSVATLVQLLRVTGANTSDVLYSAGVSAIAGLLAGYGAVRARVAYAALLSGVSFLLAWLFLADKIFSHPSLTTYRWLLVAAAAVLLAIGFVLMRRGAIGAREVATTAGIAAIAAGTFGIFVSVILSAERALTGLSSQPTFESHSSSELAALGSGSAERHAHLVSSFSPHSASPRLSVLSGATQHLGWDIYLLIASLLLLWLAARGRNRGLGYVGGFGLLGFILSVGSEVARVTTGEASTHSVLVWPLVLLLIGAFGLIASFLPARRRVTSASASNGQP